MTEKILKSCIASLSIIICIMSCSQADEQARTKVLDRLMYTINPEVKLIGPVFRDNGDKIEKSKYISSLLAVILKEADIHARKYLEAGDSQAYYAFLILALTVPLHEGVYIQFRNVDGDVCSLPANNGELVKKSGPLVYSIFNQYFKNPARPYFPNCEAINLKTGIHQMIRSGDGSDLSIMQISIRWHFDDFLANKKYESVAQTLGYGFKLLLNGFDPVYRNISDYKCLFESVGMGQKNKINYINLIKGVWAGKYNSGSISQTCRFLDPNSPFKKHDIGFAKNLDKILKFNGAIAPDYIGEIKVDDQSSAAIKEVVSNLIENKNYHKALDKVLE
jgi:hypothetical protein